MASITVRVNAREYRVSCDDGQEEHLRKLAGEVDQRVRTLAGAIAHAPESELLVITAVILADELHDMRQELGRLRGQITDTSHSFERSKFIEMEQTLSATINDIAERIERITGQI